MSTTPSFDPSKLGNTGGGQSSSKKKQSERVIMVVTDYETPADGAHYAIGHRFDNPNDLVKVRLTTVKERLADNPKVSEEKVKSQYFSGDNTRETIETKAKNGIGLIAFDDSYFLGKENGVSTFRSHWPTTISTSPDAELMHGQGHIRLREADQQKPGDKSQAYVELLRSAAVATKDNIDQLFASALSITDDQGRARDPFMVMRISHANKVVGQTRIYPATEQFSQFDQNLGEEKVSSRAVDAAATFNSLMSGGAGKTDLATRSHDTARAIIAGLKGEAEPTFASNDAAVRDSMRNLYFGAAQGQLTVEVIAAEKIDFGKDTRKTYLKDAGKPQLAAFNMKEPVEGKEGVVNVSPGFAPVAVGVLRHENGEPYAVYASPIKSFPYVKKLGELSVETINRASVTRELEKVAEANGPAQEAEKRADVPEAAPPAMIDDSSYEEQYEAPEM